MEAKVILSTIKKEQELQTNKIIGNIENICREALSGNQEEMIQTEEKNKKIEDIKCPGYGIYKNRCENKILAKNGMCIRCQCLKYYEQIENLYEHMKNLEPFSNTELSIMFENFKEYMIIGGMPAIVNEFVKNKNYSGTLKMQKQILLDYEEDITKYAKGLERGKILNVYHKIPVFLGKENKKFQISKIETGARNREYLGTIEWLDNAGIINVCYCLEQPELPLGGNFNPDNYRIYFRDTGLLIGSLDEESQDDLRYNKNFNTYKGAIYENIVADMLVKEGYHLYFYKNPKGTIEMDFFLRDKDSLIPVEVKANDGSTLSLNKLIDDTKYKDVKYGIKLGYKNIGFNGKFYTFPYFLTFLLKRYLKEKEQKRTLITLALKYKTKIS